MQYSLCSMEKHSFLNIPKCLSVLFLLILFRFSGRPISFPDSFKLLFFKWLLHREDILLSNTKNIMTKHVLSLDLNLLKHLVGWREISWSYILKYKMKENNSALRKMALCLLCHLRDEACVRGMRLGQAGATRGPFHRDQYNLFVLLVMVSVTLLVPHIQWCTTWMYYGFQNSGFV